MRRLIAQGLAALPLPAEGVPAQADALARYGALLLARNRTVNLTAITVPEEVARLHMLDCAAVCAHYPLAGKRVIDVGTGAGFPGLVWAVLCPQAEVVLLDPLEKRLRFLQEVIDMLGLSNVSLVHARAEDAGRDAAWRAQFDVVTARAVAELQVLGELCLPFLRTGGLFLCLKSAQSDEEVARAAGHLAALGGAVGEAWDYTVPTGDVVHRVWPIEKQRPTPEQFPRRWSRIVRASAGNGADRPEKSG